MIRRRARPFGWSVCLAWVVGAFCLAAGCGPSTAEIATEDALLRAAQEEYDATNGAGPPAPEANALAAAAPQAARDGDRLLLHFRGGQTKTYASDRPRQGNGRGARAYKLLAYARSRGLFAIRVTADDGGAFLLVSDEFGRESQFGAMPYFSPTGERVLALLNGTETRQSVIQIWRRNRDYFTEEWSGSPRHANQSSRTDYALERWDTEDTIAIHARNRSAATSEVPQTLSLRLASQGWEVVGGGG